MRRRQSICGPTLQANEPKKKRLRVSMSLTPEGMAHIPATPDLQKAEMKFVNRWKEEGLLESFYQHRPDGGVPAPEGCGVGRAKELIGMLPYFPYMAEVQYFELDKQF